jgi:hypothetical protein
MLFEAWRADPCIFLAQGENVGFLRSIIAGFRESCKNTYVYQATKVALICSGLL